MENGMNFYQLAPESSFGQFCTKAMNPIMRWFAGWDARHESHQQTHMWNYLRINVDNVQLERSLMVYCGGVSFANPSHFYGIPRLHMPRFGGWEDYVVLRPSIEERWFVGWITYKYAGISRIILDGSVRMLIGPTAVNFFGISLGSRQQIQLTMLGRGLIGLNDSFKQVPLL